MLGRRGGNGVPQELRPFVVTWDFTWYFPSSTLGRSINVFPDNSQLVNMNVQQPRAAGTLRSWCPPGEGAGLSPSEP